MKRKKKRTTTDLKDDFVKRLLYIIIGLIPFVFLINNHGPERFIGLAGFLFSLFQLVIFLGLSPHYINEFFPPKKFVERKTKPFDKFIEYFCVALFFISLLASLFEIRHIENTILGMELYWKCAVLGIVVAIVAIIILKKTNPSVFFKGERRNTVYICFFLCFPLLLSALGSSINHTFSEDKISCNYYYIESKETGGKRNKSSWLFIQFEKNTERLKVSRELYNKVDAGERIHVCLKKGKLGYDFVYEFEPSHKSEIIN